MRTSTTIYPNAFSVNLVNDADASHLAAAQAQLTQQVRQGDILMAHVDYWQANNPRIVQIYQDAGVWTNPTAPQPTPATTTTALAVSANSIMVGTSVTLTATVSPATAAGTVTFYDGTVALGSGNGELRVCKPFDGESSRGPSHPDGRVWRLQELCRQHLRRCCRDCLGADLHHDDPVCLGYVGQRRGEHRVYGDGETICNRNGYDL